MRQTLGLIVIFSRLAMSAEPIGFEVSPSCVRLFDTLALTLAPSRLSEESHNARAKWLGEITASVKAQNAHVEEQHLLEVLQHTVGNAVDHGGISYETPSKVTIGVFKEPDGWIEIRISNDAPVRNGKTFPLPKEINGKTLSGADKPFFVPTSQRDTAASMGDLTAAVGWGGNGTPMVVEALGKLVHGRRDSNVTWSQYKESDGRDMVMVKIRVSPPVVAPGQKSESVSPP